MSASKQLRELADMPGKCAFVPVQRKALRTFASEVEVLEKLHEWAVEAQNHNADQAVKLQKMLTETEARLAEAEVQP